MPQQKNLTLFRQTEHPCIGDQCQYPIKDARRNNSRKSACKLCQNDTAHQPDTTQDHVREHIYHHGRTLLDHFHFILPFQLQKTQAALASEGGGKQAQDDPQQDLTYGHAETYPGADAHTDRRKQLRRDGDIEIRQDLSVIDLLRCQRR